MSASGPPRWRLALFAFALGSLSALALVGITYYAINRARQPQPPLVHPRPVYSRQTFSRLVLGKSAAEVIEAIGRPDETSEDDDARYWRGQSKRHLKMPAGDDAIDGSLRFERGYARSQCGRSA